MKILTAAEMRAADQATAAEHGVPSTTLMENAGAAVARFVMQELSQLDRIVVLCGKGNNGGDGFVAARILAAATYDVDVLLLGRAADVSGDARASLDRLAEVDLVVLELADEQALRGSAATQVLADAELFLDAVLGTGFRPPMRGMAAAMRDRLAAYPDTPMVSVDVPSGWDADSREFRQEGAYRSNAVVTFTAPKLAHVSGCMTLGPLVVAAIGSPDEAVRSKTNLHWAGSAKRMTEAARSPDSNKGKFGHVAVISGARGRAGAAAMASYAALRAGAGLVSAVVPASVLDLVAGIAPELMTEPLRETARGSIALDNLEDQAFRKFLEKKTVVAIGPGLGQEPETQQFALRLIELCGEQKTAMVLDADCLNAIAEQKYILDGRDRAGTRTLVLTPHPGEMARLVGKSIADVQSDREGIARAYATEHHITLVLKGWRTLIAHPDGRIAINTTGNPGLAKGGSGDILTGITAALLAQYSDHPADAVEAAVYLHGLAADFAVADGDEHTLLATDVCDHLATAYRFRAAQRHGRTPDLTWIQGLPGMLERAYLDRDGHDGHEASR